MPPKIRLLIKATSLPCCVPKIIKSNHKLITTQNKIRAAAARAKEVTKEKAGENN
jgi:hypothetical protein